MEVHDVAAAEARCAHGSDWRGSNKNRATKKMFHVKKNCEKTRRPLKKKGRQNKKKRAETDQTETHGIMNI